LARSKGFRRLNDQPEKHPTPRLSNPPVSEFQVCSGTTQELVFQTPDARKAFS
jgi:hypothetical protein